MRCSQFRGKSLLFMLLLLLFACFFVCLFVVCFFSFFHFCCMLYRPCLYAWLFVFVVFCWVGEVRKIYNVNSSTHSKQTSVEEENKNKKKKVAGLRFF